MFGNIPGGLEYITQISMTVTMPGRGPHGYKHQVSLLNITLIIRCKNQSVLPSVLFNQIIKAWFIDGYFPVL